MEYSLFKVLNNTNTRLSQNRSDCHNQRSPSWERAEFPGVKTGDDAGGASGSLLQSVVTQIWEEVAIPWPSRLAYNLMGFGYVQFGLKKSEVSNKNKSLKWETLT